MTDPTSSPIPIPNATPQATSRTPVPPPSDPSGLSNSPPEDFTTFLISISSSGPPSSASNVPEVSGSSSGNVTPFRLDESSPDPASSSSNVSPPPASGPIASRCLKISANLRWSFPVAPMVRPAVIQQLAHVKIPIISLSLAQTFSSSFLEAFTRSRHVGRGVHEFADANSADNKRVTAYCLTNRDHQELLPPVPGQHGTQITGFAQEILDPAREYALFVRKEKDYLYFGVYRGLYRDTLGRHEMMLMPDGLRYYWAEELHKPEMRQHLRKLWPLQKRGWYFNHKLIPYDRKRLGEDMGDGNGHLAEENVLYSRLSDEEAAKITFREILEAFEEADEGDEPSLRLHYEHMMCVGYDQRFYDELVAAKTSQAVQTSNTVETTPVVPI